MDRGFILHAMERTQGGRTELHLIGRLDGGETFAIVERRWTPFFHVRAADGEAARRISGAAAEIFPSDRRTMDGAAVETVRTRTSRAAQELRDALHRQGVRTYEADVRLPSQYLMDHGIHGTLSMEGEWRKGRRVGRIYTDPRVTPAEWEPRLSVLSLDIETDARADRVYAVGLHLADPDGRASDEVLLNGAGAPGARSVDQLALPGAASARCLGSEKELLSALRERIIGMDPDILTGWNVIDFDFRVLARRFAACGVPFDIGRSDAAARFLDREDPDTLVRWNRSKAIVPGRQVLDGMWLARMAGMGMEDYRLETVAQAVLGRGKRIDELPGESRTAAVERLYRTDPESLCVYCLEDTRLALEILQKEGLLDIALRKALLIGTQLEQTSLSVASFEFLYTEHMHRRGLVAPTLGIDQDVLDKAPGGGIITPRAGLYRNVLVFDFKSLYPSIIRTFNIDPHTYMPAAPAGGAAHAGGTGAAPVDTPRPAAPARAGTAAHAEAAGPITAPNGARFSREPGILPEILDRFFQSREEARRRGDKRAVYSYKIVMNSFYGCLGTPGCRFASSALSGAITTFGQHILYWARDTVAASGREVIYGDTDSLFVLSGAGDDVGELSAMGAAIAALVNGRLADYTRAAFGAESRMEIQFEKIYRRFFLPPMRTTGADTEDDDEERGRAKGYAGLAVSAGADGSTEERLEVKGLEAVRHDWTPLAQELQCELLDRVFHGAEAGEIGERVRGLLRALRAGERDAALTYRRSLRKPVEAYTRSAPPHARAAALLPPEERTGLIRYVWTVEGPQPESRRTAPLDYGHYVEKQVRPIVESLAPSIGLATESIFAPGGQLGLF